MSQDRGYEIEKIPGNGDCGYTALGTKRATAYQLIKDNLKREKVCDLLLPAIKEEILLKEFYCFLIDKEAIATDILFDTLQHHRDDYAQDEKVIDAYLDYRVLKGDVHMAVLQTLAYIDQFNLRIWMLGENKVLIPHSLYPEYQSNTESHWNELLFTVGPDHFNKLNIQWGRKGDDGSPIYPFPADNNNNNNEIDDFEEEESDQSYDAKDHDKEAALLGEGVLAELKLNPKDPYALRGKEQLKKLLFLTMRPDIFCDFAKKYITTLSGRYNKDKKKMGEESTSTLAILVCEQIKAHIKDTLVEKHIKKYNEIDKAETTKFKTQKKKDEKLLKKKRIIQNRLIIIKELLAAVINRLSIMMMVICCEH